MARWQRWLLDGEGEPEGATQAEALRALADWTLHVATDGGRHVTADWAWQRAWRLLPKGRFETGSYWWERELGSSEERERRDGRVVRARGIRAGVIRP